MYVPASTRTERALQPPAGQERRAPSPHLAEESTCSDAYRVNGLLCGPQALSSLQTYSSLGSGEKLGLYPYNSGGGCHLVMKQLLLSLEELGPVLASLPLQD
ncbi:unnamed protein product [Caretta caretta]